MYETFNDSDDEASASVIEHRSGAYVTYVSLVNTDGATQLSIAELFP